MLTARELKNCIVNGLACDHAEVLGDRMRSEIHALSLQTFTPGAWAKSISQ